MVLLKQEDIVHKAWLLKLLAEIADDSRLASALYFKGGTCAAGLGYLDRFSIDLDFDLKRGATKTGLRSEFKKVFKKLDFAVQSESNKALFFVLKYAAPQNQRNTLKISVSEEFVTNNDYKPAFIPEIDRLVNCQTLETMFANKLVALVDRYKKHQKVAGRDIYDIHYFFSQGYKFKDEIIKERTNLDTKSYFEKLIKFIERNVTDKVLAEDLNTLLPSEKFKKIRKTLKSETLIFLRTYVSQTKSIS